MANTSYNTREDMIDKSESLKGKTKIRFFKNISNYNEEMKYKNFQFEQNTFGRNAQVIGNIYHEV